MKKYILLFFVLIVCFSCKKDLIETAPITVNATSITQDTMLPLAIGNYWIYQRSDDDSIGTYTMKNIFDSLYVEKDSMIKGEHYFKLTHSNYFFVNYFILQPSFNHVWIKDSLGFLVTSEGEIALNPVNLRDTIYRLVYPSNYFCLVPDTFINRNFVMGQFSGLWIKGYSFSLSPFANWSGQHYFNAYAKNIGLLRMRRTFASCPYSCRFSQHLIRYHLN